MPDEDSASTPCTSDARCGSVAYLSLSFVNRGRCTPFQLARQSDPSALLLESKILILVDALDFAFRNRRSWRFPTALTLRALRSGRVRFSFSAELMRTSWESVTLLVQTCAGHHRAASRPSKAAKVHGVGRARDLAEPSMQRYCCETLCHSRPGARARTGFTCLARLTAWAL